MLCVYVSDVDRGFPCGTCRVVGFLVDNQNLPIVFDAPVSRGGGGGPRAPGPDNCVRFAILRWPGVNDAGFAFLCAFIPPVLATVAFVCFTMDVDLLV